MVSSNSIVPEWGYWRDNMGVSHEGSGSHLGPLHFKGDDFEERLIRFAVSAVDLADALPTTFAGKHTGTPLLRPATSRAPNHAETRGCESMKGFIHKLGESGGCFLRHSIRYRHRTTYRYRLFDVI